MKEVKRLEKVVGYTFQNIELLKQAITHSSYANEQKLNRLKDYERLEFLGDAVLELISSEFLYSKYPNLTEGEMTKMRSSFVCEPALAYCAREISLGDYGLLGRGEEATGGRERDSIISDMLEAIIGAIYLDGGFTNAKEFINKFVLADVEHKQLFFDSKTILQEMVQGSELGELSYQVVKEEGPEHDKQFLVEARLDAVAIGSGYGKNKKAAEQKAAYEAIMKLKKGKNKSK